MANSSHCVCSGAIGFYEEGCFLSSTTIFHIWFLEMFVPNNVLFLLFKCVHVKSQDAVIWSTYTVEYRPLSLKQTHTYRTHTPSLSWLQFVVKNLLS